MVINYLRDSKNETVTSQANGTCLYNGTWFQDKEELPTRGLCLVCHCFPGFVEPNAFTCSVIDCPWEDYHRRFPGCTPIYADRDCCPIGWECDYGTQNPGQQPSECDCEWRYLKHYEAKGCRPVYEEKKPETGDKDVCTCPWRFDCSQADDIQADEKACLYKKHIYPIGSKIPTSNPCESCSCTADYFTQAATISCSTTECPSVYSKTPLPDGCHYVYKENQCCPTSVECPTGQKDNIYQVPSCEYKGKMFYEGEQIYPDEDPCLVCLCSSNWTGPQGATCRRHDCMLERDSRKLKQGCIPIYHEKTCCPIDYHCADEDFDFKSNRGASFKSDDDEDEMCFFDGRYYPIGHVLDIKYPTSCVTCTCKTPPDFTCIHAACPPPPNKDYAHCRAVYKPHACCPNYTCEEKKDSKSCPDPICQGTNCWLVKREDGCQTCRCKSRCMPCPPMCTPENPDNECSGCICQINSTALFDFEQSKKVEDNKDQEEDSLQKLIQECKNMECPSDERCMLVEQNCDNTTSDCLPIAKCEKVSFGCGQSTCPEGCHDIGSYENNCSLCHCKESNKEPQYKLTCKVQSCEENCILTGRDEGGCPICKCPQGNLEERACASSPCNGFNCTLAVNSLGCVECRCQLSCKPKECPVGCDMDLDVPENNGLECGCLCKNSTTAMDYIQSKPTKDTCHPVVSCRGLNCTIFDDDAGCPGCKCRAPCPAPVCQEGCRIEKEDPTVPGRCPGCACKLSRSARDNSGKADCPPPTCLGYNCSVITEATGCQKCYCESPCEEAPQCPSHCKLETNVPEGRCRGCVCSYGEHLDPEQKHFPRGGGKIPDGSDSANMASEKREDMDADFIPLPGKDLIPGVDKYFLVHGGKDQYADLPGYHYSGGHAFPVFGEPLESALYSLDDLVPGELESGSLSDEAREEIDEEGHEAYAHDEAYGDDFAEEKALNEEDEEKCARKNCPDGQKCVIRRLQCIRTPCPTIPVCIDVEPRCPIPMCAIGCMVMKWDDEVCPSCFCGIIRGAEGRVCPRTRCAGRRCYNVIGDDGCPQCKCDSICIPPKCYDGCHIEKDPPAGKCATCICEDRGGSALKPPATKPPAALGTTPSPNTTGSNVDLGKEHEKPEDSKDNSEATTLPEADTEGRNPSIIGSQFYSGSDAKPEIVIRNKLPEEDPAAAEFYNSLAYSENEVLSEEPTTVTVNLPTTINAADVFASTTAQPEINPKLDIFTTSKQEDSKSGTQQTATHFSSEELAVTEQPIEAEKDQVLSLNIFDFSNRDKTSTAEPITEKKSTKVFSQKFDKLPSRTTVNPFSNMPNENSHNKLKPLKAPTVLQSEFDSDKVDDTKPTTTTSRPLSNKHQVVYKPEFGSIYNDEIEEEDPAMKPILQNLQQLMSNLHHVLSTHQRPDMFQHFGSSVTTTAEPQTTEKPNGDKNSEKPNTPHDYDLKQSETENQDKIVDLQSNEPTDTVKSTTSSLFGTNNQVINHSINEERTGIKQVENTTVETQSNASTPANVESQQQQQYFLGPNIMQSAQHHSLPNQQIVPSPLHQGLNTQFHMFPQYPYQPAQSNFHALGMMQPQAPYQNHLQSVYAGNGPHPIFNAQPQNPYYTPIQQQPFISNVGPFPTNQFGQQPSQVHKQHVLLTNIPIPPSLQQQLNAGTQTLGFLQQLINHRNNPFYQQQLLQSLQHQMGFTTSEPIPNETPSTVASEEQGTGSNDTEAMSMQNDSGSTNQQAQEMHNQYVYANNQPLSSQQQFENGEVGSQSYGNVNKNQEHKFESGQFQQQYINQQQAAESTASQLSSQQNIASSAMPPFPDSSSQQAEAYLQQFNHHAPQQITSVPLTSSLNSHYQSQHQNVHPAIHQHLQAQNIQSQYSQQYASKPSSANEQSEQTQAHVASVNAQPQEEQIYLTSTGNVLHQEESNHQHQVIETKPIQQNVQQSYVIPTASQLQNTKPQTIYTQHSFNQQQVKPVQESAAIQAQSLLTPSSGIQQEASFQRKPIQQQYTEQPNQQSTNVETYNQQPHITQPQPTPNQQFHQTYFQNQQQYFPQQINIPQQQFQQSNNQQFPNVQQSNNQQFPNVQQSNNQQFPNIQQGNAQQTYILQQNSPQQQNLQQQLNLQQQVSQFLNNQNQQNVYQQQYVPQQQNFNQQTYSTQQYMSQQQNIPQQQQYMPQIQNNFVTQNTPQPSIQSNQQHNIHHQQNVPRQTIYQQQSTQEKPVAQPQHQFISSQSTFAYQSPQAQQQLLHQHYLNANERTTTEIPNTQTQDTLPTTIQPQELVQQSNQQYHISDVQPLKEDLSPVNMDNIDGGNQAFEHQSDQEYIVQEDNQDPQKNIEDQVLVEPSFSEQDTNEEQSHVEISSLEDELSEHSTQQPQEIDQHHIEALKPLAQITTNQNKINQQYQSQDNLNILGPNTAEPIQHVLQDLKTNTDSQSTQSFLQQTVPPFQQEHLPNNFGVKTRPGGAIFRPHFAALTSPTTTEPPTSTHDLFPAPSRPINNKPQVQQQDWVDQEFSEGDFDQEFDYDDFDLPESTTIDPFAASRQSVTPPQEQTTVQPEEQIDELSQQPNQYEVLANFDNHQPDSVKKPLDQQEHVDEFEATSPKFFSRTTPKPVTANSSNVFASFPTASPTPDVYSSSGSRHSTKAPSPIPSYQCPTPHCNGYNCSLIRGSDGCQKCVCDSPCAPCPQHCVKTKTLSEGRCPICDCTGTPTLSAANSAQCPVVNCRGSNCRKIKDSNGCPTCICDPKCVEPQCDPGCEVLRDVPPGQCPGCLCRVTVVQAVVPHKQRQCLPVTCGRNCQETRGPDGCPLCMCNPECPNPKCDVGCQVQTDVAAGECPTCVCPNFSDDDDDDDDDLYCPNLFCSEYGCREVPGPAGCPICMCDPICKTPVCEPGCQIVSNKYHGKCPVCVCRKPVNGTQALSEETIKTVQQSPVQQQEQSPVTFMLEPVEAEEATISTLHTTVTVDLNTGPTTEPTTEPPTTACPAPVCNGLRCNMETGVDGCEICKCKYKCPVPKCVGHCYAETNAPSHRCPGCVCPQKPKPPKH
ncbi:hypothetical protein JTE90_016653 [Oedothorax gibbosus]|uniref:VWFC domain-containing protein n=1 Tax=Oedothorax gibbosus TaxID=931172 RepID=A0AAV6V5C9_9ARAC|nr:hypothetical protein JTE90_016653 [Oedothorax gibbosus]